jgi:hypothetical protein
LLNRRNKFSDRKEGCRYAKACDQYLANPEKLSMGRLVDLFRTKQLEFGVSLDTLQLVLNSPNLNPALMQA